MLEKLGRREGEASEISTGVAFLDACGISRRALDLASRLAASRGTEAHEELIAAGFLTEENYWARLAEDLKLPFVSADRGQTMVPAARFVPSEALRRADRLVVIDCGKPLLLVAPSGALLCRLRAGIRRAPQIAHRIRIASPETIRGILLRRRAGHYVACAAQRLRRFSVASSAFGRPGRPARARFAATACLIAAGVYLSPAPTLFFVTGLMSLIFFNSVVWKLVAAFQRLRPATMPRFPEPDLPSYTIMVPLLREANIVPELIRSLSEIDYPRVKLQILLIVEADDAETIMAIRKFGGNQFQTVHVPSFPPRTKPKALVFALPLARGDYVVVYDAEDRPEPDQLRQAASAFAADPDLGCIQARLTPDNSESWLSRMFTIEYAANFDVLLPALAAWHLPLPLGGTSNHFPRRVLQKVGAWDPYNVTEDADLGFRLARHEYRIGMIASRTYEEAPVRLAQWLPQRRRWLKGWMQTILVMMDRRDRSHRHLSWGGTLVVHGLLTGGVISLLAYPLIFVWPLILLAMPDLWQDFDAPLLRVLMAISLFNVGGFGVAVFVSALRGLSRIGRWRLALILPSLPIYYLLISFATWQALGQLLRAPHFWEKTAHGVSRDRFRVAASGESSRRADGSPIRERSGKGRPIGKDGRCNAVESKVKRLTAKHEPRPKPVFLENEY